VSNDAAVLLGSGAAIFITNVIVFGIWYWELDRGGPFARHAGERLSTAGLVIARAVNVLG
jgi:hypothetical protein